MCFLKGQLLDFHDKRREGNIDIPPIFKVNFIVLLLDRKIYNTSDKAVPL